MSPILPILGEGLHTHSDLADLMILNPTNSNAFHCTFHHEGTSQIQHRAVCLPERAWGYLKLTKKEGMQ